MCARKNIHINKSLQASEARKTHHVGVGHSLTEVTKAAVSGLDRCLLVWVCESLYCLKEQACLSVWRPTCLFTEQIDFSDFFLKTCSTFQEQMWCAVCLYWPVWLYVPSCVFLCGLACLFCGYVETRTYFHKVSPTWAILSKNPEHVHWLKMH